MKDGNRLLLALPFFLFTILFFEFEYTNETEGKKRKKLRFIVKTQHIYVIMIEVDKMRCLILFTIEPTAV